MSIRQQFMGQTGRVVGSNTSVILGVFEELESRSVSLKVGLVRGLQFRFQRNWGEDVTWRS